MQIWSALYLCQNLRYIRRVSQGSLSIYFETWFSFNLHPILDPTCFYNIASSLHASYTQRLLYPKVVLYTVMVSY
jgi:hypothetical protein